MNTNLILDLDDRVVLGAVSPFVNIRVHSWLTCSFLKFMASGSALLGLALIGALFLTGCQKPGESSPVVVIEHEVSPQPLKAGVSAITLKLTDASGDPINGARINLEGTMTHPGMRPVFSEAREAGSGRYQSSLEFTMAGDWIVLLHITLPNGQKLERQFEIKGVQPGW
ncbi:MAG: FixH family protein [Blastocatellia bacterium]